MSPMDFAGEVSVVDDEDDAGGQDGVLDLGEALGEVLVVSEKCSWIVIRKIYFK